MLLYKVKDFKELSRKAANIISAQVILKPTSVLGLAEDPKFHMLMMALFYSGRKSEGFRTVYPMIDRFYHLCVDVFDNASAELGNMNGRQEQFAVGFSGILMHYLMMTAGDQSDLSNLVVRDEEVYRLVHQFMYGIYS